MNTHIEREREKVTQRERETESDRKRERKGDGQTETKRQTDRQRKENRAYLALIDFTGAKILSWHHTSRGHDANQFIEVGI